MNMFSSIIFADSYNQSTHELTKNRTLSSLPFCGRFRLIDFTLSSLVHAGVSNVAIVPKKNYASLSDHLGDGKYWDLDHRNSGLKILSPFFRAEGGTEALQARGRLDALRSVQTYIRSIKEEYVVISDGNLAANIDYEKVFSSHLESDADITVVYSNIESHSNRNLELSVADDGKISDIIYSEGKGTTANVSLNIYVIKKELLMKIIRDADAHDVYSFNKYVLINNTNTLKIMGYKHEEFARLIYSIQDYYKVSMETLCEQNRKVLFNNERPVLTRVKDSVPTLYRYNAKINNSLIADGCKIDGTVKNSIIFRNVTVETGAVIENCIVMQNTVIGRGSNLKYTVLDKNVKISDNKQLCGDKEYPFVLEKNSEI